MNNKIWQEDLERLAGADWIDWNRLKQKTILITGANGLIGSSLIRGLMYINQKYNLKINVVALVRDRDKALKKFADLVEDDNSLLIIQGNVEHKIMIHQDIDFIIHGASPTASRYFIEKPVETIKTSVNGTINMLELAVNKKVKSFVFLSSMEIYGSTQYDNLLSEKDIGYINPLIVRNCYPESKRQCEALCAAYADEYNVPTMSIRLAQTFGQGVDKKDARVFAEFARCVKDKKNIVLFTEGESKRCYLYTMDAVSAIFTVLLKGESGKAYNAGNPATYCSIKEMAQMVTHELANDVITVKYSENLQVHKRYMPPHFLNLDMTEISKLGWKPTLGLKEMYLRILEDM